MSSMFPDKFVPYLPNVVPAFLQSMKLDELGDDPTLGEREPILVPFGGIV
jgi:hypothetical protein